VLVVYVTEAHAEDEWPIGSKFAKSKPCHNQPQTTAERCHIARLIQDDISKDITFLVDPIANGFEKAFAPWPIRFYVVEQQKLTFQAEPKNCMYDIRDLRRFLDASEKTMADG